MNVSHRLILKALLHTDNPKEVAKRTSFNYYYLRKLSLEMERLGLVGRRSKLIWITPKGEMALEENR